MGSMRLDFVFCYLSEHVIKGYSLGVAIRVILNQLQHLLHIRFRSCISEVSLTFPVSAWDCLAICSFLLLIVGRKILGPVVKLGRRLRTPFSIDFMLGPSHERDLRRRNVFQSLRDGMDVHNISTGPSD
ncbi:sulfate permease family domain-containing protein [Ditylenchus destructor]|uniref:Sulfate permease family domain-containing protein n=1 Tax=Ditylenchus destructor TaxID=166010 RepID=A0AAD4QX24_9BILA|nr:sulfate permease family domain-containing protein [Ditylenchus destructor]